MPRSGLFYFSYQSPTRKSKRAKKIPEEIPTDLRYLNINPRLAHFINSLHKNKKGTTPQEDKKQTVPKDDKMKKEIYPVLPEIPVSSAPKNTVDYPSRRASQIVTDEEQFMNSFEEYKYSAPTLLHDLGKLLHFFSQYKVIFPQGVVNVLNYSWKELTEGAVYTKRSLQSMAYKRAATGTAHEESQRATASPETAESVKNNKNKMNSTMAESGKEKVAQMVQTKPTGNKSPQVSATSLPVTISFSMSSTSCEDRGWISEEDSKPEDMELRAVYSWAVQRLQLALIQINKEMCVLKEKGFCKPVILEYYNNGKNEPLLKKRKTIKTQPFVLLNGKPRIPEIKSTNSSLRKLHFALIDGSRVVYYPSGHLAVCQSHSGLQCGGLYTNIFSPDQTVLGTFTPFGHGSICFPDSNIFALQFNQERGMMADNGGNIIKEWDWPLKGKLTEAITLQVNEYLSFRIVGQYSIILIYKWQYDTVRLSVSPLMEAAPPQLEDLGILLTSESFTSRTARELGRANKAKTKEKETKKNPKKKSILSELAKTLEIPEDHISPSNDLNTATELRKLQRKIKNILDDWMEHYRLASGIDSPEIQKMSDVPPRILRKRKIQSAAVLQITSPDSRLEAITETDEGGAPILEGSVLRGRFKSAPAPAHKMLWDTPQSSPCPRPPSLWSENIKPEQTHAESCISKNVHTGILGTPSVLLMPLEQDMEKQGPVSQLTCPGVLRRLMLSEEGRLCRCSNHHIPYVTDLEYDWLINNQMSSTEQITVVCVVSSLSSDEDWRKDVLEQLYEKKNKYRSMPCMQSRLDSFRLLKYDIGSSSNHDEPLLVQRHNVAPGMFLMYICGKLLFANYIFNGYSRSAKDLKKQIAKTRSDYHMGYSLPNNFKFNYNYLNSSSLNTTSKTR